MAGIARRAAEDAAKAVGQVQVGTYTGPQGSVAFTPQGAPVITPGSQQNLDAATLARLSAAQGGGAEQLAGGVTGFGREALGTSHQLLTNAGTFDPLGEAEKRFQRLQEALQPSRQREQAALQEQLFAQGRGSSGIGSQREAEQQAAFRLADIQALNQFYGEAQQAQNQAIQTGLQAGAGGTTAQQSQFQQFQQGLGAQQSLALQPFQIAQTLQGIAAGETSRRAAAAGALTQNNQVTGQVSGGGGFGAALGGLAGASIGGLFGGTEGATAGATVGSNLGSFL